VFTFPGGSRGEHKTSPPTWARKPMDDVTDFFVTTYGFSLQRYPHVIA
jgi:hypothetical protein